MKAKVKIGTFDNIIDIRKKYQNKGWKCVVMKEGEDWVLLCYKPKPKPKPELEDWALLCYKPTPEEVKDAPPPSCQKGDFHQAQSRRRIHRYT